MHKMAAKENRFKSSRVAERRRSTDRREWGRIANRLLLIAVTLGFVYGVEKLGARLDAIPVERVVFAGDLQRVDRNVLVERVTGHLAVGYIGLDLAAIQTELEREPWVYRAVVERLWPRELKITIVEETPIAVWGRGGLLNHRGRIFVPKDDSQHGEALPRLDGPEGSAIEIMRQYRLMSQLLGDEKLTLQHLEMDARGSWTARIDQNVELVMGRREPLEKLRRFLWVYREYLAADFAGIARVDMRYINGLAVAWTEHSNRG